MVDKQQINMLFKKAGPLLHFCFERHLTASFTLDTKASVSQNVTKVEQVKSK